MMPYVYYLYYMWYGMSMNRMSNQQLLVAYHMTDGNDQDNIYREITSRIVTWGVLTGQRTHMPRQVIIDLFRRHMNRDNISIPPDRVEGKDREDFDGIDWFMGEDENEDLFKI